MAERDLNSEFTGNVSIFSQTKPRQAVKVDPTDDAHMTTHQPPPVFRYRDSAEITPGAQEDGSDGVALTRIPIGPKQ